ncbi:MAG: sigma-70 family RNA polymerase sigma factor [Candidatus Limiplasma sp.]|nr:sigma-70 family RNA polymerase sigma factor [Candidatus Limiplasma sp.]
MNDEHLTPLWERYLRQRDAADRDQLFENYLPVARTVARKFAGRGVETEDLEQVAAMAMLKAMERFQPEKGFRFVTYAVPTITGELRHYLRDRGSAMRLPRDGRQRLAAMAAARQRFEQEHFRAPTAIELAQTMRLPVQEVLTLLSLQSASETVSLDVQVGENGDTLLQELMGGEEAGFARVENAGWWNAVLERVNPSERELLTLRYRQGLGQRDTARQMGVSQMQVSRMERRVLTRLRAMETTAY